MTDAKFDDYNGEAKVIKKDQSYTVTIKSNGNGVSLQGDMLFEVPLKTIVQAFVTNGARWYKWKKDDSGKLVKETQDSGPQIQEVIEN